MNAYISFLLRDNPVLDSSPPSSSAASISSIKTESGEDSDPNITLICISGSGDFDYVKNWCETTTKVGRRAPT